MYYSERIKAEWSGFSRMPPEFIGVSKRQGQKRDGTYGANTSIVPRWYCVYVHICTLQRLYYWRGNTDIKMSKI